MDVTLPDGTVIRGIPEGTTKEELYAKLKAAGYDVGSLTSLHGPELAAQREGEALKDRMGPQAPAGDPLAKPGTPVRKPDLFDAAAAGQIPTEAPKSLHQDIADRLRAFADTLMAPLDSRNVPADDPVNAVTRMAVEPLARLPEALVRDPVKTISQDYNPIYQAGMGYQDVVGGIHKAMDGDLAGAGVEAVQGLGQMAGGALGLMGLKGGPKAPGSTTATSLAQAERMAADTRASFPAAAPAAAAAAAPEPPPAAAAAAMSYEDVADLVRTAARGGMGSQQAVEKLARAAPLNKEAAAAAERLGIDVPPDVLLDHTQLKEAIGLTRSMPGTLASATWADAVERVATKADEAMAMIDGSPDLSEVSDSVLKSMQNTQKALQAQSDDMYKLINAKISGNAMKVAEAPPSAKAAPPTGPSTPAAPPLPAVDTSGWGAAEFQAARNELKDLLSYRKTAPANEIAGIDSEIASLRSALDIKAPGTERVLADVPLRDTFGPSAKELGLPEPWEKGSPAAAKIEKAYKAEDWTLEQVPTSKVIPTQDIVYSDFSEAAGRYKGKTDELPLLVKQGDQYFVMEGHHRLMAGAKNGNVRARVIEAPSSPSTVTPFKPGPKSAIDDVSERRAWQAEKGPVNDTVLYHGMPRKLEGDHIRTGSTRERGAFLTEDPNIANHYAAEGNENAAGGFVYGKDASVLPVYVRGNIVDGDVFEKMTPAERKKVDGVRWGGPEREVEIFNKDNIRFKFESAPFKGADKPPPVKGAEAAPKAPPTVDLVNSRKLMDSVVRELGGDTSKLSSLEKQLVEMASPGRKTPVTYAALMRMKSDVGQALERASGPYKDVNSGILKRLYGALAEDQLHNVERIGGPQLRADLRLANQLTAKRKALEDRIVSLFGDERNGSVAQKLVATIKSGAKGDVTGFNRIVRQLPQDLRKKAVATAIAAASRETKTNGFGFAKYVDLYQGLRRNSEVYKTVVETLGPESAQFLNDLYKISKRITEARANVKTTGQANQALVQGLMAEGLVQKVMQSTPGRMATVGGATAVAGGTGGTLAGASAAMLVNTLSKSSKKTLNAAGDLFASPEWQQLVSKIAAEDRVDKRAFNAAKNSKAFQRWTKEAGITNPDAWLRQALASSIGTGLAQQSQPQFEQAAQ